MLIAIGVTLTTSQFAHSQEKMKVDFVGSLRTNTSLYDSEFKYISIGGEYGVNVNNLYLTACYEYPIEVVSSDEVSSYELSNIVGTALAYDFLHIDNGVFDVRAMYGATISNKNWEYHLYDVGVSYSQNSTINKSRPFVGLGVRYYDFTSSPIDDKTKVYFSFGIKF